ncbi:MFS sugar transporter [Penicillium riverlandense]|uniref:MFS sugar transporter n=1 Tax=Penicillium riverlandense TaxID=1903569 RepID=UPI002546FAA7|nr:MFS sugar transporter [Penicillium riverlandense]KAJ5815542.1 MFS sugar transporter [Penicillium riverlandense]
MTRKYLGGSGHPLTVWISAAASTVLVFYGYDQGVFGNVIINKNFLETFGNPSSDLLSTMASLYTIGAFVGSLSTMWSGDIIGRPRQLTLGSIILAVGAIIQSSSFTVPQMIVGRIIAGIGTGMNTATASVWQAETSKVSSRGKLIIVQMANCITGFVISNWLTLGFSFAKGSVAWRFPLAFQVFFSLLICLMCPFLPDSPRLLLRQGKQAETLEVLAALEGNGANPDSPSVKAQFEDIRNVLDTEQMNTYSWAQLLTGKGPAGVLRRMMLGIGIQAMNQLSGINLTSYYMSYIFENALNFDELLSRLLAAAASMDYLFFACAAFFTIERFGRRKVMISSSAACCVCWVVIAIVLALSDKGIGDTYNLSIVAVAFFFIFFASFGMGILGVTWVYAAEINALEMRTKGTSLAAAIQWIVNYMVVQITPIGIQNLSWRFWIIWAIICFSFIPVTYLFYPETTGRSLEDIDRYFEGNPGIIVARDKDIEIAAECFDGSDRGDAAGNCKEIDISGHATHYET